MNLPVTLLRFNSSVAAMATDVNDATLRAWKRQGWYVPAAELLGQVEEGRRVPYQLADVVLLRVMKTLTHTGFTPKSAWEVIQPIANEIITGGRYLSVMRVMERDCQQVDARFLESESQHNDLAWDHLSTPNVDACLCVFFSLPEIRSAAESDVAHAWLSENPPLPDSIDTLSEVAA